MKERRSGETSKAGKRSTFHPERTVHWLEDGLGNAEMEGSFWSQSRNGKLSGSWGETSLKKQMRYLSEG